MIVMTMLMTRWAVRLLACHPLVQERLQAELDQVNIMLQLETMVIIM